MSVSYGEQQVEPDCDAMSAWFNCRDISTAPADVRRGYQYMHNTSRTLGPFGTQQGLSDAAIVAVASYVRSAWGNDGSQVSEETVAAQR